MYSEFIKALRKEHGLSQMWMARFTGISRYKLSLYENGYLEIPDGDLELILEKYPPSPELLESYLKQEAEVEND